MPHTSLWNMLQYDQELPGLGLLKTAGTASPAEHFILRRRDCSGPPWRDMTVYIQYTPHTLWNMLQHDREPHGPSGLKTAGRVSPAEHFILRRQDCSGPPWRAMAAQPLPYMPKPNFLYKLRPYDGENTRSRLISAVKLLTVSSVLR